MHKLVKYFLFILLSGLFFVSCKKDQNPSWDVDVQIPLIKTSLSIDNLIPDSIIQTESNHTLTLVYKNPIYSFDIDSLVEIPDTITSKFYPAYPGIQIAPGQSIYDNTEQETFNFNGADVNTIILSKGYIVVDFVNTVKEKIDLNYRLLSATKNGQYFQVTETIPAATDQPFHYRKRFDVSGYTLDLTGQNHLASNHLVVSSKASLSATANAVTLTSQDVFDMLVTFENVGISYARGYFAQQAFSFGPSETAIKMFDRISGGDLDLESVNVKFTIENNFGIDARVKFRELTAINTHTNQTVALCSPLIGKTINISRALETGNNAHPVTPTHYEFDLNGSNIKQLIENLPDRIRYAVDVESNPMGNISSGNDFVYGGNYLKAYLDMVIPLSFMANNLSLGDTSDFSLGNPDDSRRIDNGTLMLIADNGFPFDAELALYALDSYGNVLDVLIDHKHIAEAPLNSEGFAERSVRTQFSLPMNRQRIDLLYKATKLYVAAYFNTANTGSYVQIYDSYKLDLKVTGTFNYVVE